MEVCLISCHFIYRTMNVWLFFFQLFKKGCACCHMKVQAEACLFRNRRLHVLPWSLSKFPHKFEWAGNINLLTFITEELYSQASCTSTNYKSDSYKPDSKFLSRRRQRDDISHGVTYRKVTYSGFYLYECQYWRIFIQITCSDSLQENFTSPREFCFCSFTK